MADMSKRINRYITCLKETIEECSLSDSFCYNELIDNGISLFRRKDYYEAYYCEDGRVTWMSITYHLRDAFFDILSKLSVDEEQMNDAIQYFSGLIEEKKEKKKEKVLVKK